MLQGLEVLQVYADGAAEPAARAVRFAAGLAEAAGASLFRQGDPVLPDGPFHRRADTIFEGDPLAWAAADAPRIALLAAAPGAAAAARIPGKARAVFVELEPWHGEATLFAASALADLNGHPDETPLVPAANYAAHSIGYAAYAALSALDAGWRRFGRADCAVLDGLAVMAWINWKAGAAGAQGKDIHREGPSAEWPVLECRDGHVAFVFTERDWPAILEMVGDPVLADARLATNEGRKRHRDAYMASVRDWCAAKDKADIKAQFDAHGIPGAPVSTIAELLRDPLFVHRQSLQRSGEGVALPRPALRLAATAPARDSVAVDEETGPLPLSGLRVLDLGIITAGAGVSAVLADLGAEVLKVESAGYPDPFRHWAGSADSPLFRFNNRNKYGLDIDLKTDRGRAAFLALARDADIVLENFRRGVLDRLGLGFEALHAANPAILLASISGQGLDGPGAGTTTFGSTLEASAGFSTLTRDRRGLPYVTGRALNYPDQIVCLYGAAVITSAVAKCRRDGRGRHIDISQRDCALYQIGDVVAHVSAGGSEAAAEVRAAISDRSLDGIYECADGACVALSARRGAPLGELDGWNGDPAAWAAARDGDAAVAAFLSAGQGAAKAAVGSEMVRNQAVRGAGAFARGLDGALVKGFPFQFLRSPMRIYADAPAVGAHNDRYLEAGAAA